MTGSAPPPALPGEHDAIVVLESEPPASEAESSDSFLRAVAATSLRAAHVAQLERDGTMLGDYRIEARIGSGGMGIVYRALDAAGRRVALKVLRRREDAGPEARRRFVREARAAFAIQHERVARVLDSGEIGDEAFLAMELLEGESLRALLSRGPMPMARVLEVAAQVAQGVAAAHAAGVIHRDLKPENVMIDPLGGAKILDFGLACWAPRDGGDLLGSVLTVPGGILGTAGYMSPEQGRGRPVDERTDTFSMGIVLFEMVAGERPFTGRSPTDVFLSLACDPTPDLGARRAGVAPALVALVEKMLAKDPAARPRATEVAAALEGLQEEARG